MQDRMTVAAQTWRTDAPPVGQIVEVWSYTGCILATWDGHAWRKQDGRMLIEISHWRPYHA